MSNGGRIPAAAESTTTRRACVQDLEPVRARLEAELRAEVDRAEISAATRGDDAVS